MTTMPDWAVPSVYEYDLGMAMSCNHCGERLVDGQTHWFDKSSRPTERYCSTECVIAAEGTPPPPCDWCGEPSTELGEVDDSDPSVGYRSVLSVCPTCMTKRRLERVRP